MGKNYNSSRLVNGLSVDASGNVGIGNSPNASYKLAVTGTGNFTGALRTSSTFTSGDTIQLGLASTDGGFWTWGASNSYLVAGSGKALNLNPNGVSGNIGIVIATSGNVGIGTGSPASNLQIGSTTSSSTTTPVTLSMGGTYGTTILNGIKIKLYDDGTTIHGLGVIAGNLYLNATDGATNITLNTNNTERMRITSTGNVGIGTGSPSQKLEVGGGSTDGIKINTSDIPSLYFYTTGGSVKNWGFAATNLTAGDFGLYQANANGGNPITAGTARLYFTSGGNVGINNNNPQSYLDVSNNGTSTNAYIIARNTGVAGYRSGAIFVNAATGGLNWYLVSTNNSDGDWGGGKFAISTNNATGVYLNGSTATSWTGQSDIRLKDVDSEIEDALNKVNQLRGVKFTWKSDETKKMQVGLIAQEVKEVLPEAVDFDDTNEDYKMGVQYTDLIPLLVNAIKELSAKVTALENANVSLKVENDELRSILTRNNLQ